MESVVADLGNQSRRRELMNYNAGLFLYSSTLKALKECSPDVCKEVVMALWEYTSNDSSPSGELSKDPTFKCVYNMSKELYIVHKRQLEKRRLRYKGKKAKEVTAGGSDIVDNETLNLPLADFVTYNRNENSKTGNSTNGTSLDALSSTISNTSAALAAEGVAINATPSKSSLQVVTVPNVQLGRSDHL